MGDDEVVGRLQARQCERGTTIDMENNHYWSASSLLTVKGCPTAGWRTAGVQSCRERGMRGPLKALDLHMELLVRREWKGCTVQLTNRSESVEVKYGPSATVCFVEYGRNLMRLMNTMNIVIWLIFMLFYICSYLKTLKHHTGKAAKYVNPSSKVLQHILGKVILNNLVILFWMYTLMTVSSIVNM